MNKIKFIVMGLGLLLYASLSLAAGKSSGKDTTLYKWVDDNGETHYGEVVPPEYADRDQTQLDSKGIKARLDKSKTKPQTKTPEELAAIEQRRKDKALLNTYSNEKEIDLARGRNLQQVEARINSIELQSKTIDNSLQGYLREQANLQKAGKPIPESLRSDLANSQSRMAELQHDLKEANEKAAAVRASFDADKARYHELTVGPAK